MALLLAYTHAPLRAESCVSTLFAKKLQFLLYPAHCFLQECFFTQHHVSSPSHYLGADTQKTRRRQLNQNGANEPDWLLPSRQEIPATFLGFWARKSERSLQNSISRCCGTHVVESARSLSTWRLHVCTEPLSFIMRGVTRGGGC